MKDKWMKKLEEMRKNGDKIHLMNKTNHPLLKLIYDLNIKAKTMKESEMEYRPVPKDLFTLFYKEKMNLNDAEIIDNEDKMRKHLYKIMSPFEKMGLIENRDTSGQKDDRFRWKILTEFGEEMATDIDYLGFIKMLVKNITIEDIATDQIDNSTLEKHSEEIRDVINKIIEDLPEVDNKGIFYSRSFASTRYRYDGKELNFESSLFYNDLKTHMKTIYPFSKFNDDLTRIKTMGVEYNENIDHIAKSLAMELNELLGLQPQQDVISGIGYSTYLIEWIIDAMFKRMNDEIEFDEDFFKLKFKIEGCNDPEYHVLEIDGMKMVRAKVDEIDSIIEKIKLFLSTIQEKDIYKEYSLCLETYQKLVEIRRTMMEGLKQESHIHRYPGVCKYISNQ